MDVHGFAIVWAAGGPVSITAVRSVHDGIHNRSMDGRGITMLVFRYETKKALTAAVGEPLKYRETSFFGPEYKDNGRLTGSNRPFSPEIGGVGTREYFANVTMQDGLIAKVS